MLRSQGWQQLSYLRQDFYMDSCCHYFSHLLLLLTTPTQIFVILFLLHNTMHKCSLCCHPVFVCPSICLFVTSVYCIHMAEDIIKLLSWPGSPIILVFWPWMLIPNSKGNPISRDTNYTGMEFAIFSWNRCLSQKQYERGPWSLWNINRKS